MLNDLPVLNNYQVFTSPGYVMEEVIAFCFSSTYRKLLIVQLNHRGTQFGFGT